MPVSSDDELEAALEYADTIKPRPFLRFEATKKPVNNQVEPDDPILVEGVPLDQFLDENDLIVVQSTKDSDPKLIQVDTEKKKRIFDSVNV